MEKGGAWQRRRHSGCHLLLTSASQSEQQLLAAARALFPTARNPLVLRAAPLSWAAVPPGRRAAAAEIPAQSAGRLLAHLSLTGPDYP